eukprot:scaffold125461_cov66-Phaeocystis_antarctica.AAC.4
MQQSVSRAPGEALQGRAGRAADCVTPLVPSHSAGTFGVQTEVEALDADQASSPASQQRFGDGPGCREQNGKRCESIAHDAAACGCRRRTCARHWPLGGPQSRSAHRTLRRQPLGAVNIQPSLLIGWSGVVHHVAERWRGEHLDAWRLPVILLALLLRKQQAEQLELGLARARLRQHGQREVAAAGCIVVLSHKDALDRSYGGAAQYVVRVNDSIAAAGTAARDARTSHVFVREEIGEP